MRILKSSWDDTVTGITIATGPYMAAPVFAAPLKSWMKTFMDMSIGRGIVKRKGFFVFELASFLGIFDPSVVSMVPAAAVGLIFLVDVLTLIVIRVFCRIFFCGFRLV